MDKHNHCPTCHCGWLSNSRDASSLHDVDERIQAVKEELRRLQSCRNRLSSIHRLPSELLLSIFRLVLNSPSLIPSFMVLTRITSVCKHWRSLCTEDATLWNNITSWNTDAINCSVQRSKSLPISMNLYLNNDYTSRHDALSLHNKIKRLQSLRISTTYPDYFEEVIQSLEEADELSLLEDLLLESRDGLTKVMFACNAPRLTTLSLTNIFLMPLPLPNLGSLCRLRVHYEGLWGQGNLTATQWLDLLIGLEALEILDLYYPVFDDDKTLDSEKRVVRLKNLKRLAFHESINCGVPFLRHLTIPTEAQMELTFQTSTSNLRLMQRIGTVSSFVKPWILPRNAITPLQSLALKSPAFSKEPRLTFLYSSSSDPLHQSEKTISVEFLNTRDIPLSKFASQFSNIVIGMKPATFFPDLHELVIDGASTAMVYALREYYWLDTLVLSGGLWPRCIEELLSLSREERLSALSNIHTLVLRGVPFHWLEQHKFLAALEGSSVESVYIEASTGVSKEDVGVMEDIIGAVTWDGA